MLEVTQRRAAATAHRESPRRIGDALLASLLLLVLAPLAAAIVTAIYLETGRPIFFLHTRIGKHGKPFRLMKFRKFHHDTGARQLPLTLRDDPRLTRVGRVLERSKLDELPQLWNVVRGDMAIVGPRPESLDFKDCFENGFRAVLAHKPGILGPSQALFRNEKSLYRPDWEPEAFYRAVLFPTKARIDLGYYLNRTLRGDIVWVFYCVLAIVGYVQPLQRLPLASAAADLMDGYVIRGIAARDSDKITATSQAAWPLEQVTHEQRKVWG